MDALHFRNSAARARAMAQNGDDMRISRMLLDLADELDAEADLIDAEAEVRVTDLTPPAASISGAARPADPPPHALPSPA